MKANYNKLLKVLLAHPGTQYSHDTARQLSKLGLLYKYCTGIAFAKDDLLYKLSGLAPMLKKRYIHGVPGAQLKTFPLLEIEALRKVSKGAYPEQVFYERNEKFQYAISDKLIQQADVVVGYDTSSWILAERAKKLGKKYILDVSIGHSLSKELVYRQIAETYPEWGTQVQAKSQTYLDYEAKEIERADVIVVPSKFVQDTYIENGVNPHKIHVNPFGTDISSFVAPASRVHRDGKELTFLFFGSLHARKGLPVLFAAWKELAPKNAKMVLAGYEKVPDTVAVPAGVEILGAIPRDKRLELYHNADVFVFPSYFEGFAQVQIEAAACGLPLIGTYNSGAEEIIENGKNGFIVKTGDKEDLKNALLHFIQHPHTIADMGKASRVAAENFSWDAYGIRYRDIIQNA